MEGYSELIRVKATCHPAEPNLMAMRACRSLVWRPAQASFLDRRTNLLVLRKTTPAVSHA